jgi:hypothetical protein
LTLLGEKESTHATLPFFNIFLNACGSSSNLKDVECCLETMDNYLLGKSEITYCELLKVCRRNVQYRCSKSFFSVCTFNIHALFFLKLPIWFSLQKEINMSMPM